MGKFVFLHNQRIHKNNRGRKLGRVNEMILDLDRLN